MKILHTSDWHLGKYLENYSRHEEQQKFIEELLAIVEEKDVDLIVVAGDIYDTIAPSNKVEKLLYESLKKLTNNGKRQIFIQAGNHDSPQKLQAISPLALENNIIIMSTFLSTLPTGDYGNYKIIDSDVGYIELEIKNERIVIINIGYPSESRLNQYVKIVDDEDCYNKAYTEKLKSIIDKLKPKYRDDTINYFVGHFYVRGGIMETSERDISLGGTFAVDSSVLPDNADYIAMGHLHRPQKVAKAPIKNAYYSGSPIQYNKTEVDHPKCVYIADISKNKETSIEKIYLHNYKPIEVWKSDSIEDAIQLSKDRSSYNCYVYFEISTDRPISKSELDLIRSYKKDIVEIKPKLSEEVLLEEQKEFEELSISEEFIDFYKKERQVLPSKQLIDLFLKIKNDLDEGSFEDWSQSN